MPMSNKLFLAASCLVFTASCGGGSSQSSAGGDVVSVAPAPSPTPAPTSTPTPPPVAAAPIVPQGGWILARSLDGAEDLAAGFDIMLGLQAAWGTQSIPGPYDPEEGAFRFICGGDGKLAKDDPIVYRNQPGASHLHQVWGNSLFDASTTPADLANSASTNCNATPYSLNRSSYWMPAMVHENGEVIKPDLVSVYYKRQTKTSRFCDPANARFIGTCVGLPSQIRFIFGWDSKNPTAPVQGAAWGCTAGVPASYPNLDELFNAGCAPGAQIVAQTIAPHCWDGKHLDSPDHRSHMAYGSYGTTGVYRCPASHPYLIPQEENKALYTVTADMIGTRSDGSKYSRVRLSSDAMLPGAKPGATLHADYMEAWVTAAKKMWMDNCIEKALSCSGGDLGNGRQLIGASQPTYGWTNPNPRVRLTT